MPQETERERQEGGEKGARDPAQSDPHVAKTPISQRDFSFSQPHNALHNPCAKTPTNYTTDDLFFIIFSLKYFRGPY